MTDGQLTENPGAGLVESGYEIQTLTVNTESDLPSTSNPQLTPAASTSTTVENEVVFSPHMNPPMNMNQSQVNSFPTDPEEYAKSITPPNSPPPIQAALTSASHRSYTVQFKINALDWYYRNGENKNLTARMFNVDRKRIRDWLIDEKKLRSDPTPKHTKRKRTTGRLQFKDIETALLQWYKDQQIKGLRPKNGDLQTKSLELAEHFGLQDSFKGSSTWLYSWKRRHGILVVPNDPKDNTNDEGVNGEVNLQDRLGGVSQLVSGVINRVVEPVENGGSRTCVVDGLATVRTSGANITKLVFRRGEGTSERTETDVCNITDDTRSLQQTLSMNHDTCEQWVDLLEQTVTALESNVTQKLNQIKLLLLQIKGSLQPSQQNTSLSSQTFSSPSLCPTSMSSLSSPMEATPSRTTPKACTPSSYTGSPLTLNSFPPHPPPLGTEQSTTSNATEIRGKRKTKRLRRNE